MYGLFMSYFQAMETPVIYKHRVAVGLGVENFLGVPFLAPDTHALQLEEDNVSVLVKVPILLVSMVHLLRSVLRTAFSGKQLADVHSDQLKQRFIIPLRWCSNWSF